MVALVAVAGVLLTPVVPAWADGSTLCAPDVNERLADVNETLHHFADVGTDGHVWALTDVVLRIQVWQLGTNHFCIRPDFNGTFTSFAGVSPNLTGARAQG
ncbi:MAG: hypothetical protein ABI912_01910 [Actinomycetota bacterium]